MAGVAKSVATPTNHVTHHSVILNQPDYK